MARIAAALRSAAAVALAAVALGGVASTQPVVVANGETMRLKGSSAWNVTLTMDDDNGNAALATSWRRCEIRGLRPQGETLLVKVANAG